MIDFNAFTSRGAAVPLFLFNKLIKISPLRFAPVEMTAVLRNDCFLQLFCYLCRKNVVIMSQSAVTIRIDSDIKNQFDSLCEEFGMSVNTAFNIYVRNVVRNRRIPFQIEAAGKDDAVEKGRRAFSRMRQMAQESGAEMTLEEINEEIRLAREGR